METQTLEFGGLLGKLLVGNQREVKIEITCRIVDDAVEACTAAVEVTDEAPAAADVPQKSANDDCIPRPFLKDGRIDGMAELAKFLTCSTVTAQKLKNDGAIPYYQRGARVYFYEDEILASMRHTSKKKLISGTTCDTRKGAANGKGC